MKDEASFHHGINVRVSVPTTIYLLLGKNYCNCYSGRVAMYYVPTCCAQLRHRNGFQKCGVVMFIR